MEHLVQFWNYRISSGLTGITGLLLLWQYFGSKGTLSHVIRWAALLLLSLFVVYMNTVMVLSQPPMRITNLWHIRFMAFHQNMGSIYFALLAAMPLLGVSLMASVRYRWTGAVALRFAHRCLMKPKTPFARDAAATRSRSAAIHVDQDSRSRRSRC